MTSYFILSESDALSHDANAADPEAEYYGGNREHPIFRILKSKRETTHKEKENQIMQAPSDGWPPLGTPEETNIVQSTSGLHGR